jgi:hypothetical protein
MDWECGGSGGFGQERTVALMDGQGGVPGGREVCESEGGEVVGEGRVM